MLCQVGSLRVRFLMDVVESSRVDLFRVVCKLYFRSNTDIEWNLVCRPETLYFFPPFLMNE